MNTNTIIENAQGESTAMTGNGIMPFQNAELNCSIEVIERDGEPWFLAKSICDALQYGNSREALSKHVRDKWKGVTNRDTLGGIQQTSIINEAGLFALVMKSKMPKAVEFQDWVCEEVLPSIRKHGAYATDQLLNDPDLAIRAFTALKEEREKNKALALKANTLEVKVAEDKPKVLFANAVADSESTCLLGEFAKILKQNGINIGQNRLFTWMREHGYLIQSGEMRNTPTQRAMELGLFRVKKGSYTNGDGVNIVTRTVKITGKGQQYFINKFLGAKEVA